MKRTLISCDWGLSKFRLRFLAGDEVPEVVAEVSDARGIAELAAQSQSQFGAILQDAILNLFQQASIAPSPTPVCLSGMVVSSLGWKQLPYAALPFPLDGTHCITCEDQLVCSYGTHTLLFISGISTCEDAMRGEECEVIGLFSRESAHSFINHAVAVLPGTHSKSIEIRDGEITAFRTFMTGELFELLCRHSVLRHSVGAKTQIEPDGHFESGVRRSAEGNLLGSLFAVRARDLLEGMSEEGCRGYLSGLLIGDELAAVIAAHPASVPIVVGGSSPLQRLYLRALEILAAGHRTSAIPEEITSRAASFGHWLILSQRRS